MSLHIIGKFEALVVSALLIFFSTSVYAIRAETPPTDEPVLTLEGGSHDKRVSDTFYGLMTEEINHSYDGGLYAELIQNRSFQDDAQAPLHWSIGQQKSSDASIALDRRHPVNDSLPTSLRLEIKKTAGEVGIANDGFWGIPAKPSTTYRASFYARADIAAGPLTVSIQSDDGSTVTASGQTEKVSNQWQRFTVSLKTSSDIKPSKSNRFIISTSTPGTYWFSLVSLFPPTWHDRSNGCRPDLMQLMADLKPAFLRCPGGNYLEGKTVETRFQWKNTLGDIADRPGHMGTWSYRSSDGMGLLEFLEWSEDIGADPVLAVYAGYSLPSKEHPGGTNIAPGDTLKPFVDEAVEEIEYAIGGATTKWGARRIADGHPAPFHIQYVEIGNEDFLTPKTYEARFAQFYDALKAAYPSIKYIATIPVKSRSADVVDDHYYKTSDQMAGLAHRYDKTDRSGPKVFVGEWATREIPKTDATGKITYAMMPWAYKGGPTPTMHAALGDAAFMTGLERNSDVVVMNCYAPMLTRVDPGGFQWCPNMIGYDSLGSFGSPSYYVQQMFNVYRGDVIIGGSISKEPKDIFYSATRDSKTGTLYLKVVNRSSVSQTIQIALNGLSAVSQEGELIQIFAPDSQAVNSIEEPAKVVPAISKLHDCGTHFTRAFAANSFAVIKLTCK